MNNRKPSQLGETENERGEAWKHWNITTQNNVYACLSLSLSLSLTVQSDWKMMFQVCARCKIVFCYVKLTSWWYFVRMLQNPLLTSLSSPFLLFQMTSYCDELCGNVLIRLPCFKGHKWMRERERRCSNKLCLDEFDDFNTKPFVCCCLRIRECLLSSSPGNAPLFFWAWFAGGRFLFCFISFYFIFLSLSPSLFVVSFLFSMFSFHFCNVFTLLFFYLISSFVGVVGVFEDKRL